MFYEQRVEIVSLGRVRRGLKLPLAQFESRAKSPCLRVLCTFEPIGKDLDQFKVLTDLGFNFGALDERRNPEKLVSVDDVNQSHGAASRCFVRSLMACCESAEEIESSPTRFSAPLLRAEIDGPTKFAGFPVKLYAKECTLKNHLVPASGKTGLARNGARGPRCQYFRRHASAWADR